MKTTEILFTISQLSDRALGVLGSCQGWGSEPGRHLCEQAAADELASTGLVRVERGSSGWDRLVIAKGKDGKRAAEYADAMVRGRREREERERSA